MPKLSPESRKRKEEKMNENGKYVLTYKCSNCFHEYEVEIKKGESAPFVLVCPCCQIKAMKKVEK